MISDEHLSAIKSVLKEYPPTPGSWLTSPRNNGGGVVHKENGDIILEAGNHADALLAAYAASFLAELVEEVSALRALPGNHYQKAGLQRRLTRSEELKALSDGAVVENSQGKRFEAVTVRGTRFWYHKKSLKIYRTKEIMPDQYKLLAE